MAARLALRGIAVGYLGLLLALPVGLVFYRAFEDGLVAFWDAVTTPEAMHAFWLTCAMVAVAVPLNTLFGVLCAMVLVRQSFRGKAVLNAAIDLPFAVSPVVIGLALILVYGREGWVGEVLIENGIRVIFSPVGMVLATIFISLPFVAREVAPVLREIGTEQEQAAETLGAGPWQSFLRITLPAIRWGVAYGVVLTTARALGEFGPILVFSGATRMRTEVLPTTVFLELSVGNLEAAVAVSLLMVAAALIVLVIVRVYGMEAPSARVKRP